MHPFHSYQNFLTFLKLFSHPPLMQQTSGRKKGALPISSPQRNRLRSAPFSKNRCINYRRKQGEKQAGAAGKIPPRPKTQSLFFLFGFWLAIRHHKE
jgi:hypothetical protein